MPICPISLLSKLELTPNTLNDLSNTLTVIPSLSLPSIVSCLSIGLIVICMQASHSSCIIIVKNNKITGIFTERDIVTKIVSRNVDLENEKICDYMTNNPEILQSDDSIAFALNKMTDGGFRHVPIVHSISKDLYVISMQDIINSIGDYYFSDILNLPPKPLRSSSHREGA